MNRPVGHRDVVQNRLHAHQGNLAGTKGYVVGDRSFAVNPNIDWGCVIEEAGWLAIWRLRLDGRLVSPDSRYDLVEFPWCRRPRGSAAVTDCEEA